MITITDGKRTHYHPNVVRISMYLRFSHLPQHYGVTRMHARRYARRYPKC